MEKCGNSFLIFSEMKIVAQMINMQSNNNSYTLNTLRVITIAYYHLSLCEPQNMHCHEILKK